MEFPQRVGNSWVWEAAWLSLLPAPCGDVTSGKYGLHPKRLKLLLDLTVRANNAP